MEEWVEVVFIFVENMFQSNVSLFHPYFIASLYGFKLQVCGFVEIFAQNVEEDEPTSE